MNELPIQRPKPTGIGERDVFAGTVPADAPRRSEAEQPALPPQVPDVQTAPSGVGGGAPRVPQSGEVVWHEREGEQWEPLPPVLRARNPYERM